MPYQVDQLGVFDTMDEALAAIEARNAPQPPTEPFATKPAEKPHREKE